jgi:hypothetical protein
MLLVYSDEGSWDPAERDRCYHDSAAFARELSATGHYLGANPLQSIATATSVRVRAGKRFITDGPFAETREHLGGYFLIEAKDRDEAISIASHIPGARMGTVEVRPILEIEGLPEDEAARELSAAGAR